MSEDSTQHTVVARLAYEWTYPAERPMRSLVLYYALMVALGVLLLWADPSLSAIFDGHRLSTAVATFGEAAKEHQPALSVRELTLHLALVMLGSFACMIPVSWVYMATRRKKGYDQSLIQTMVVLPVAIAGIVTIIQSSLALAFSLAGITSAIRWRNALTDTRDALYIFLAIGVGIASGVQALFAAVVLSVVFNVMVLFMWRWNYGSDTLAHPPGALLVAAAGSAEPEAEEEEKKDKKDKKGKHKYDAALVINATDAAAAQREMDLFLAQHLKHVKLAEVATASGGEHPIGKAVLKYLIFIGEDIDPDHLEDAVLERGAPHVVGAKVHLGGS